MGSEIQASVVIPTHGRRESLLRVLRALGRQSVAADDFEVIVICDGDVDGSVDACRAIAPTLPYALHLLEQKNQGPAVARNRGVAAARAPLIVFIDDDVVPDEGLIAAHLAAQAGEDARVTIGPLLPPPDVRLNPWGAWEERGLCRQYAAMAAGRWQPTYRQFYTGNAAVLKRQIVEAGGFNAAYRRAEDVELAVRFRDRGLHFVFLPEARGWHYIERSYDAWLRMSAAYGAADVAMAQAGELEMLELVPHFFARRNLAVRLLTLACAGRPAAVYAAVALLGLAIKAAGASGSMLLGNIACSLVFNLRHYDGIAGALGGRGAFMALLHGEPVAKLLRQTGGGPGFPASAVTDGQNSHAA